MQEIERELRLHEDAKVSLRNARKRVLHSDMPDRLEIADEILVAIDYLERSTWIIVNGLSA